MKARLAILAALVVSLSLGLSLDVVTYNSPTSAINGNAGIMLRLREWPACFGIEVRGHPGVIGGSYAECDI